MKIPTIEEIEAHAKSFASSRDVHATGAVLVGAALLLLVFKANKFILRLILVLVAVGLFVGAWWWRHQK